ncbi:hypothetical protein BDQ12DRAFT_717205 [Crucibulum laeve]|uniref:Uncharacterized protein n=1 Tax=Crucibulum laeve TaxID=68775 RepID=A0A5C3MJC0_9AGAR|nr:hypothetical protein BDQ12DRAFT_717205 [Crucibulum laeve]
MPNITSRRTLKAHTQPLSNIPSLCPTPLPETMSRVYRTPKNQASGLNYPVVFTFEDSVKKRSDRPREPQTFLERLQACSDDSSPPYSTGIPFSFGSSSPFPTPSPPSSPSPTSSKSAQEKRPRDEDDTEKEETRPTSRTRFQNSNAYERSPNLLRFRNAKYSKYRSAKKPPGGTMMGAMQPQLK